MLGYERNAVESKVMSVAGSFMATPELKLMALYTRQDQDNIAATLVRNGVNVGPKTNAWVLGANYTMGPGKILVGYGQKDPDNYEKTKQMSLGYEYSLSKRTYLYIDASRKTGPQTQFGVDRSVNYYDLGVNHSF